MKLLKVKRGSTKYKIGSLKNVFKKDMYSNGDLKKTKNIRNEKHCIIRDIIDFKNHKILYATIFENINKMHTFKVSFLESSRNK